jgi:7,8-dihydro-6-hydroxymethylpterin-pyrophosphokinase
VLVPLAEIAADWPVPPHGKTVVQLLAEAKDESRVEEVGWTISIL